ncbi:sentrin/sumo-specific protease [Striga asiatica]|uniref:Sentrin/sumo-specific protease n=1 Tax=Striga asiatica TaxID=4170 RepID=A0A5A7PI25_STRAF|nr:sentrin/sumo-specific protease [Striga asiatica]
MEGAGERKRKGGPLKLDWERLLPLHDNEPPPMVVIAAAAAAAAVKSNSQAVEEVMVLGDEEELHRDPSLQNISDKELRDRADRYRNILKSKAPNLKDGGEKVRVRLKMIEVELQWRYLLKAEDKWKKVTPLADNPICIGVTDDSASHGDPPSVSVSKSKFASNFCSKLDEKGPIKSFSEELSTLNRCSHERGSGSFLVQKTGVSSRQAAFKSPSYLSVQMNGRSQSTRDKSGGRSSCSPPFRSNKDYSNYHEKRENGKRFQPMRTSKRNNVSLPYLELALFPAFPQSLVLVQKTVVLVDEEELEVDTVNQVDPVGQSSLKGTIYYPSRDDPEAVQICYSDMECLAPQSYLSSTIMNFYIRYLQKPVSPSTRKKCDYHFFNTYFYNKLKQDVLAEANKETSFKKFRRWWKGVNIFEKAYIFLPIHENLHWSLITICIPNKDDESGPIILHLDSLGLHFSKSIMQDVKSFLIEEWKFLRQENVLPEFPIPDNIWDKLSRRIYDKVIEVPQQRNDYDCGLFVLFFMERFLEDAPERLKKKDLDMFGKQWFKPEEASSLRRKIRNILKEEFTSANGGDTCKLD